MQGISKKASAAIEALSYNHDDKWWLSPEQDNDFERGTFDHTNDLLSGDWALKGGTGRRLFFVDVETGLVYVPEILHSTAA